MGRGLSYDKNIFKFIRVHLRRTLSGALSPSRSVGPLIDFHCAGNVRVRDKGMKFVPARTTTSIYMIITITVKPRRPRSRTHGQSRLNGVACRRVIAVTKVMTFYTTIVLYDGGMP